MTRAAVVLEDSASCDVGGMIGESAADLSPGGGVLDQIGGRWRAA